MLPKKEKISKAKQLELSDISPTKKIDETKKLKTNRLFVTITLILTITLSLSFVIYRQIKHYQATGQPFLSQFLPKIPHLQANIPTTSTNYTSQVDQIISQSQGTWLIAAQFTSPTRATINWTRGQLEITEKIDQNLKDTTSQINQSLISPYLPEGLKIAQIVDENQGNYQFLVSLPSSEQLILIFNNTAPFNQIGPDLGKLSAVLYWGLISR